MKYMRNIEKNQNPITFMQYENSKSLENGIDNSSIQIFIPLDIPVDIPFQCKAAVCNQRKKIPTAKFPIPPLWEITTTPEHYLENPACGKILTEFC